MNVEFPYFVEKTAPVTATPGLMSYTCFMSGSLAERFDLIVGVEVPVMTVCPCSKEISDHGAHNQRGVVRVQLRFNKFFWIEEIIEVVESSVSSDIYSLLKRADEKYVTERAHEKSHVCRGRSEVCCFTSPGNEQLPLVSHRGREF